MSWLRALEAVVLVAVAAPAARLLVGTGLRRRFPRVWLAIAASVVTWIAVVAALATAAPVVLHAVTVVALVLSGLALVHARWSLRLRRRLPPGSLSPTAAVRALSDRDFYRAQRAKHGSVFKMAQARGSAVCIVGLEHGHRILREHASSLGACALPFSEGVTGGFVRYMDADTYRTYGPLLRRALGRPVVSAARPVAVETIRHHLDRLAGEGSAAPDAALERIVRETFTWALFGIEPGSEAADRFASPFAVLGRQDLASPLSAESREALAALRTMLAQHTDALVADGDAPPCGVVELRRASPDLPDAVCLDNLVLTLKISIRNVVGLMRWIITLLGESPDWAARVRVDEGLAERVVQETLRLAQSEYLYREITADVETDGFRLPRGWLLRLCVWESHRDPAVFAEPETFDPDRFLGREYTSSEYSPFGWGQHACSGASLATMVCGALVEELCTRYRWQMVESGEPEHDFRHSDHWRPSSRLRVRLEPSII